MKPGTRKLVFLLTGWGLLAVVSGLARQFVSFPGDQWALAKLVEWQGSWLDPLSLAFTGVGHAGIGLGIPLPWIPMTAIACTLLARRPADAVFLSCAAFAPLINLGLKELVSRPRPDAALAMVEEYGYALPSGHTVFAAAFFGALFILCGRWQMLDGRKNLKLAVQGALLLLIIAVGASRVHMGVHWPSDVITGFLFGGLYVATLLCLFHAVANKRKDYRDVQPGR